MSDDALQRVTRRARRGEARRAERAGNSGARTRQEPAEGTARGGEQRNSGRDGGATRAAGRTRSLTRSECAALLHASAEMTSARLHSTRVVRRTQDALRVCTAAPRNPSERGPRAPRGRAPLLAARCCFVLSSSPRLFPACVSCASACPCLDQSIRGRAEPADRAWLQTEPRSTRVRTRAAETTARRSRR